MKKNDNSGPALLASHLRKQYTAMMMAYEERKNLEALKYANEILEAQPGHGETMSVKGLIIGRDINRAEEAREILKAAIKADPNSALCWHAMGAFQKDTYNYKEALSALKFAKLKIKNAQGSNHGGNLSGILREIISIQMQLKDFQGAMKTCYERLSESSVATRDPVNWILIAVLMTFTGMPENAYEHITRARNSNVFANASNTVKASGYLFQAMLGAWSTAKSGLIRFKKGSQHPTLEALKSAANDGFLKDRRTCELWRFVAHVQLNDFATAQSIVLEQLLPIEAQNMDFVLLCFYTADDLRLRELFGNPLEDYVVHEDKPNTSRLSPSRQMPDAFKESEANAWTRLKLHEESKAIYGFEPFRISNDLFYHLTEKLWSCSTFNDVVLNGWKELSDRNACELSKWTSLIKRIEDLQVNDPEAIDKAIELLNKIENFTGDTEKKAQTLQIVSWLRLFFVKDEDSFNDAMKAFLKPRLLKGEGGIMDSLAPWLHCDKKKDCIVNLVNDVIDELRAEIENHKECMTICKLSTILSISSEIYAYIGQWNEAITNVDEALELTSFCSRNELIVKARICKRLGYMDEAHKWTTMAFSLDKSDKFINSMLVKACHGINENEAAFKAVSIYSKGGEPREWLKVQSYWGLRQYAKSALRMENYSEFLEINRRLAGMIEEGRNDQYDFHMYTMREGSPITYFQFVALVSKLSHREDFVLVNYGSAVVLLQLADSTDLLEREKNRINSIQDTEYPPARTAPDGSPLTPGFHYDTRGIDHVASKTRDDFLTNVEKLASNLRRECPIAKETWFLEFELGLRANKSERCAEAIKKIQFLYSNKNSTHRVLTGMNLLFQCIYLKMDYNTEDLEIDETDLRTAIELEMNSDRIHDYIVACICNWLMNGSTPINLNEALLKYPLKELFTYQRVTYKGLWFSSASHPLYVQHCLKEGDLSTLIKEVRNPIMDAIEKVIEEKRSRIDKGILSASAVERNYYYD